MSLSDIAILNIKGSNYCFIISLVSRNEAINFLMQNADLTEKSNYKQKDFNIIKQKDLLSHIKKGKDILTFGDNEIEKK